MLVFNKFFYKNKKSKLYFGDRVAVLNDFIYQTGGSILALCGTNEAAKCRRFCLTQETWIILLCDDIVSCTGSMTDLGKTYVLRHVSPKDAYVQGYTTLYTAKDTGSWCVSFPRTRYICVSFPSTRLMNRSKAQPYLKSTKCMRRGMAVWRIRSEIRVVLFSWPLRGSRLALQTLHPRRFLPSLPALRACIIGCTCTNALPAQARTAIDEQSLLLAHSSDAVLVSSATVSELISY
jgi:hypothetical protein